MKNSRLGGAVVLAAALLLFPAVGRTRSEASSADRSVPRYDRIVLIVEENQGQGEILGSTDAPALNGYARTYGYASDYYAVAHPSEPNYLALVGGSTFGVRDDGAHTIDAPSLASQFAAAHLTWKNYLESLPEPGSLALFAADPRSNDVPHTLPVYAAKHSGFADFVSVRGDPNRTQELVGFDRFFADVRRGTLPNFSLVIPNVCNEMHGSGDAGAPADCRFDRPRARIRRGDAHLRTIVEALMATPLWRSKANVAIVVTFDEDDDGSTAGCCAGIPGGGRVLTVVVTNHGPRGRVDPTPYNHYSLLRTLEDAFGIHRYLGNAAGLDVVPMTPLFAVARPQ